MWSWKPPLSFRDLEMRDGSGAICAEASSLWVALEQGSRRPAREIRAAQAAPPLGVRSLSIEPPARLEGPARIHAEHRFPVLPSDIDMLGHVNNAVYLRWMLDSLGAQAAQVSGFELHFLEETLPGPDLRLACEEEAPGLFRFALFQEAAEKCRGRVECPGLGR
jgi:acyl-ACP thioesterase